MVRVPGNYNIFYSILMAVNWVLPATLVGFVTIVVGERRKSEVAE